MNAMLCFIVLCFFINYSRLIIVVLLNLGMGGYSRVACLGNGPWCQQTRLLIGS